MERAWGRAATCVPVSTEALRASRNDVSARQHWSRYWLGAVRQQVITRACVDTNICRHVALDHNELKTETEMSHSDKIFVAGCTGKFHFGNFRCSQWPKFRQYNTISSGASRVFQMLSFLFKPVYTVYYHIQQRDCFFLNIYMNSPIFLLKLSVIKAGADILAV